MLHSSPRPLMMILMTNKLPTEIADMVQQIGGRQAFAMAFSTMVYDTIDLTPDRPSNSGRAGITFAIATALRKHTANKATHVIVTLEWDDTYTVKTWRGPTAAQSRRGENEGMYFETVRMVYADTLRSTVERMTGLLLSLGSMGARS